MSRKSHTSFLIPSPLSHCISPSGKRQRDQSLIAIKGSSHPLKQPQQMTQAMSRNVDLRHLGVSEDFLLVIQFLLRPSNSVVSRMSPIQNEETRNYNRTRNYLFTRSRNIFQAKGGLCCVKRVLVAHSASAFHAFNFCLVCCVYVS